MIKFLTEFAPLIAFFIGYKIDGILSATLYMLIASLIGLALSYAVERKLNMITLISAASLSASAALTIFTGNAVFIKMKPTALYSLFALIFLFTLYKEKTAIQYILGNAIYLKEEKHWRALNFRCMIFLFLMAAINEFVWRSFEESVWVNFKVFGAIPLTFIFILCQIPYIMRHRKSEGDLA